MKSCRGVKYELRGFKFKFIPNQVNIWKFCWNSPATVIYTGALIIERGFSIWSFVLSFFSDMDSTATAILHPPGVDVEFPPCTAEDLRQNVQELVAKNDIPGAVVQCEELEILVSLEKKMKREIWTRAHVPSNPGVFGSPCVNERIQSIN